VTKGIAQFGLGQLVKQKDYEFMPILAHGSGP